jgi:hypothetical protein
LAAFATPGYAAVSDKLRAGLHASSPKVRIVAIAGVAKTKDEEARALLEGALDDTVPDVRVAALDALGVLGDPASLPVVQLLQKDAEARVAAAAVRCTTLLQARITLVDLGEVQDLSGKNVPGLRELLAVEVEKALRGKLPVGFVLRQGHVDRGYGLLIKLRSITQTRSGSERDLEVKCDLTVVELPSQALRFSSNANAAVGVESDITPRLEPKMAKDAVLACAPALAQDFIEYAKRRVAAQ